MITNYEEKLNYVLAEMDTLSKKISELQSGQILVDEILTEKSTNAAQSGAVFTSLATKADAAQMQTALNAKAAIATTLSGYGILDAYTKTENNSLLAEKATTTALSNHTSKTSNPHSVTKSQVGLSNVTNVSQAALDASNLTTTNVTSWHNKLNDMTTPAVGTTVSGKQAVVVESWRSSDGSSWYRKWSDDFKECGGTYDKGSYVNDASFTINLPLSFSNSFYTLILNSYKNNNDQTYRTTACNIYFKSNSLFRAGWYYANNVGNTARLCDWICKGY